MPNEAEQAQHTRHWSVRRQLAERLHLLLQAVRGGSGTTVLRHIWAEVDAEMQKLNEVER